MYTIESSIVAPMVIILLLATFFITFIAVQTVVFEDLNGKYFLISLRDGSSLNGLTATKQKITISNSVLGSTIRYSVKMDEASEERLFSMWSPNRWVYDVGNKFLKGLFGD